MLEHIRNASIEELERLAAETRELIIDTCAKNGGHLAPSLGTVELTLALLKVFDLERDRIVWDVGHQAYAHKILTDRKARFHTLRTFGGISGFPKRSESPYDVFGTGHGGTSISAALGIKEALYARGGDGKVIAVIGDGSMTSGLAFEGMNNAEAFGKNVLTILNDNDMFIATSVGGLSRWFSRKLTGHAYAGMRTEVKNLLTHLPPFFRGERIIEIIRKALESSKSLLTPGILFEGFGFQYVGPIDGHNLKELIETLEDIKPNGEPILLHVHTKKGKGYAPAEDNPRLFHGIGPFDRATGKPYKSSKSGFTDYLGQYLPHLFRRDDRLVAITAAMPDGTGLTQLQKEMPERVYDVGMSEGHAVTFAAGLAAEGRRPLVLLYSSFLQRAFDSVVHDVALQNLPVVLLIDRGGLVGEDGATHHGVFDISFLRSIPNMTIIAPRSEPELMGAIERALRSDGPFAIRYPRGSGTGAAFNRRIEPLPYAQGELLHAAAGDILAVTVGLGDHHALGQLAALKKEGIKYSIYDLRYIKPLPEELFDIIKKRKIKKLVVIEENAVAGGAGSAILEELSRRHLTLRTELLGLPDQFIPHGTQAELREKFGVGASAFASAVRRLAK